MYILKNKAKFLSPIHKKGKLNISFISLLLLSILCIYSKFYIDSFFLFVLLINIKISTIFKEIKEYMDNVDYEKWLNYKNNIFIENILKYSGYIFYITTLILSYIIIHRFLLFNNDQNLPKILYIILLIGIIINTMSYYNMAIKLKQ